VVRGARRRDLAFRDLAGDGPVPDFRTINRFRGRHREDFAWVLRATVRLARGAGLVKLGLVTVDGTKLRANRSRHKAMSHARLQQEEARLEAELAALVAKLDDVQAAEDREHGEDEDGSGGLAASCGRGSSGWPSCGRCGRSWRPRRVRR
jgi:hypothetical protein